MPRRTNDGLRKVCGCPRKRWSACAHPWHFGFSLGKDADGRKIEYRFSLHRYAEKPLTYVMSRTEAEALRDHARGEIRAGRLSTKGERIGTPDPSTVTLDTVAEEYLKRYARTPSRRPQALAKFEEHVGQFVDALLPNGQRLGARTFTSIIRADLDLIFEARLELVKKAQATLEQVRALEAAGRAVPAGLRQLAVVGHRARKGGIVGLNRFKARIRHLWNWSIAQGYADASPFKRHGVVVIGTDSRAETERTRRLSPQEEDRLVAAANPRLRGLIIAALSTGCRRGELLALRWADVQIDAKGTPKTITLSGSRTKTGQPRVLPIGPRLRAVLTMRTTDLAGEPLPPTAYVFGNEVGEEMPSIREAWARACAKAGIADLHFHDLRREFACRLLESRAELHDVRDFLGHSNISMTSRYLHATPLRLERALGLLEAAEAERIRKPFANGADQPIAADDESDLTGETVTLKN